MPCRRPSRKPVWTLACRWSPTAAIVSAAVSSSAALGNIISSARVAVRRVARRDNLNDLIACPPCTPVGSCINDCATCETCVSGSPTDPSCDPDSGCPAGSKGLWAGPRLRPGRLLRDRVLCTGASAAVGTQESCVPTSHNLAARAPRTPLAAFSPRRCVFRSPSHALRRSFRRRHPGRRLAHLGVRLLQ